MTLVPTNKFTAPESVARTPALARVRSVTGSWPSSRV